jgi:hypothetical protein
MVRIGDLSVEPSTSEFILSMYFNEAHPREALCRCSSIFHDHSHLDSWYSIYTVCLIKLALSVNNRTQVGVVKTLDKPIAIVDRSLTALKSGGSELKCSALRKTSDRFWKIRS